MEYVPEQVAAAERDPEAYRIPEIGELEEDFRGLVEALRDRIDANHYTLLVSDEVGGRIPTLALRKVIEARHPGQAPHTIFVAGGRALQDVYASEGEAGIDSLGEYLRLAAGEGHRALVVTQVIDSGNSIGLLADAVRKSGAADVGVAAVRSIWRDDPKKLRGDEANRLSGVDVAVGGIGHTYSFDPLAAKLGGVAKRPAPKDESGEAAAPAPYRVHPAPYLDVVAESGRQQFQTREGHAAALGISAEDDVWEKLRKMREGEAALAASYVAPVTDEERAAARQAVVDARADVDLMARRVVAAIWGAD